MDKFDIYNDISKRTGGDIYLGVVGPVRTGKSTFITKFLEKIVIPNINNKFQKQIATDEMPQSADGKIIMTTQPKFVPANAVKVQFKNKVSAKIRLVDCVGYLIEGVSGHIEDDKERLVKTPWDERELPFSKAAEIGTKKVINEYSTIGVLVTTDGSIGDIPRKNYVDAEERVVDELRQIKKPFVVILNSANPFDQDVQKLASELEEKYGAPVITVNIKELNVEDVNVIMEKILYEFPMCKINVNIPKWMGVLPSDSEIISQLIEKVKTCTNSVCKMKDYHLFNQIFEESENFSELVLQENKMGEGELVFDLKIKDGLYYKVLSEQSGEKIENDYELMAFIKEFSENKKKFAKIKDALQKAEAEGYGVVMPSFDEMSLQQPTLVKQGGRYGVKLKATAPSLHIMKVDVFAEISPSVETEKQGEDMVAYMAEKIEESPDRIWQTNMFGKTLHDLVREGLNDKITAMPQDARNKLRRTLSRMVNENKGGMICILL